MEEEKIRTVQPTKKPVEDTITLPKSEFDSVLKKIKDIEEKNDMLESVADKGRVARWQAQHRDFKEKIVKISTIEGKVVTGWRMIKDEVGKNPNTGLWFEKQIIELHFIDNTKKEYDYADFTRLTHKIKGKVIRDNKFTDADGMHEMLTIDVDGKEIDIDVRFIN